MNDQTAKRQEVGYVLLEECNVLIPSNAIRTCHTTTLAPHNAYHSINIQGMDNYVDISVICEGDGYNNNNNNIDRHPSDDLIIQPRLFTDNRSGDMNIEDEIDKFTWESVNGITPFNGLLSEIYIWEEESINNTKKRKKSTSSLNNEDSSNSSSSPSSPRRRRRRSDASLLVALSVEINNQADEYEEQLCSISSTNDPSRDSNNLHLRQLRTKDIQIMFWGEDEPSLSNTQGDMNAQFDSEKDNTNPSGDDFVRIKASLLVTYSLPIYDDDQNAVPLGEEHNDGRKQIPKKVKRLSSGHQLLGSIIRCDWEYLDVRIKKLQQKALAAEKNALITSSQEDEQKKSSRKPFFPDSLNVGELYERISGASKYFDEDTSEEGNESNAIDNADATTENVEFLDLPEDIISTSIAPYLRALSLHALRVSNRKMYKCLRANVPGLKLKLFQHQIRSLEWMEIRERQCITEDDVLCRHNNDTSDYFLHGGESVCGG